MENYRFKFHKKLYINIFNIIKYKMKEIGDITVYYKKML